MNVTITPSQAPVGRWNPTRGSRTDAFVTKKTTGPDALSGPTIDVVLAEASEILSYCVPPTVESGSTAVLAVGYVQSGKTLSFTTVTSLARDNGFGIVVVLAGTTNNLKGQSEDRLAKDLGLEDLQRDWRHFDNPDLTGTFQTDLRQTLANWSRQRDGRAVEEKPAILITVLKHASRLNSAAEVLKKLALLGVPTLVIDDESDQAGLNTKARQNLLNGTVDESGTYEAIVALRKSLPHHSYLQYTATPQANLLLSTADVLDPSFAKVISSGIGYTGGQTFFRDRRNDLVLKVPNGEIFDPSSPFTEPPEKLQEALQVFLLGISAGAGADGPSNRSMMVQAHQNTQPHSLYAKWVRSMIDSWAVALSSGNASVVSEVETEFAPAYKVLSNTVEGLPPLSSLLGVMAEKIADVRVVVVNSTKDAEKKIKWKTWEYWILIGGQKLDRGFTVEGLTVTYMPRPVSANADVLQQRARFFGYRAGYIDYCRVYLVDASIAAFAGYVEDEEFLRDSLREHEGKPLRDWKRDFILHKQLSRPTRVSVVGRKLKKLPLNKGWIWPKSMHVDGASVIHNREQFSALRVAIESFVRAGEAIPGTIDRRAAERQNVVASDVPVSAIAEFLLSLRFSGREDSLQMAAVEMALGRLLSFDANSVGDIVFMSDLSVASDRGRSLGVLRDNIHVGMNPAGATGDAVIYSGDRTFANTSKLTIQLRMVKLSSPAPPSDETYNEVPWLALYFPVSIANDAWLEDA